MHDPTIHLTSRPGRLIARLEGDVDFATCARLDQLEALAGVDRLTLDLRDVTFVDSAGTAALQDLAQRLEDAGGDVVLTGVTPQVRHLLDRCGAEPRLRVLAGGGQGEPAPRRFSRDADPGTPALGADAV